MLVQQENESRPLPLRLQWCAFLGKSQCCRGNGEIDAVSTARAKALSSKRRRLAPVRAADSCEISFAL